LAAMYMLNTDMYLSDIALGCGFVDQAHLCRHFRMVTGETPAAWRRAKRALDPAPCRYSPPTSCLSRARCTQAINSSAANGFMR
jgi:AraC-like DNA-binding protein